MIKNNFPIIVLFTIVIFGVWYSIYSGNDVLSRKPSLIDSRCYGIDVPSTIKYNQSELFCSCVHAGGHISKDENINYCTKKFSH